MGIEEKYGKHVKNILGYEWMIGWLHDRPDHLEHLERLTINSQ